MFNFQCVCVPVSAIGATRFGFFLRLSLIFMVCLCLTVDCTASSIWQIQWAPIKAWLNASFLSDWFEIWISSFSSSLVMRVNFFRSLYWHSTFLNYESSDSVICYGGLECYMTNAWIYLITHQSISLDKFEFFPFSRIPACSSFVFKLLSIIYHHITSTAFFRQINRKLFQAETKLLHNLRRNKKKKFKIFDLTQLCLFRMFSFQLHRLRIWMRVPTNIKSQQLHHILANKSNVTAILCLNWPTNEITRYQLWWMFPVSISGHISPWTCLKRHNRLLWYL